MKIPLFLTEAHPCPYLPGREARNLVTEAGLAADDLISGELNRLGFRRSGHFLYRPHCEGCQACESLRIPVGQFHPGRTHRRILRRNSNLSCEWLPGIDTDEAFSLYAGYIESRHTGGSMSPPCREDYRHFLASAPGTCTRFLGARDANGTLLGVMVCDGFTDGLSAVFSFYRTNEPERSLGTWMILLSIQLAAAEGLPYVYPGFYVAGCRKMAYKARFQPLEVFRQGQWQPFGADPASL